MIGERLIHSCGRLLRRAVIMGTGLVAGAALACSVPVFRYALEHWTSDPYHVVVLHRGPLPEASRALVRQLQGSPAGAAPSANLKLEMVDLAAADSAMLDLWKKAGSPGTPWLMIGAPRSKQAAGPMFSGALTGETVAAALDSPARREISRRLGEGESAVWVMLESGDPSRDDAAMSLLESRLAYLATVLELPKLEAQDLKNGLVSVPDEGLKLAFSTLRVARNDPAERVFVPMLLATEDDLAQQREPIVFPVFGQARVLYALVGKGIKHETIDRAAGFLIGSCSCQVKEQNPGSDLLMTTDWNKLLKNQSLGVPDLPSARDIVGTMPESVTIAPHGSPDDAKAADCCRVMAWVKRNRIPAGAALVLAFGGLCGLVLRKVAAGSSGGR